DLDAGEDAERRELLVEFGDDVELAAQPVGGQAVGDLEPRRVVGQGEVLVAEGPRRLGHLPDRRAAVRPVAVGVQVAFQRGAQGGRGLLQWLPFGRLQAPQVDGGLAAQRLLDHQGGDLPDPGKRGQRAVADAVGQLAGGRPLDDVGGVAERPHPVGRLVGALQQEGDPAQRFDGLHAPHRTRVCRTCPTTVSSRSGRPLSSLVAMAGDTSEGEPNPLRAVLWKGIAAAAVTGRAEPAPPLDRPRPAGLRWTRFLGVGRLPFGLVTNLFWIVLTILIITGTNSMLREPVRSQAADYPGDGTAL